jgi:hypothetical protein
LTVGGSERIGSVGVKLSHGLLGFSAPVYPGPPWTGSLGDKVVRRKNLKKDQVGTDCLTETVKTGNRCQRTLTYTLSLRLSMIPTG